MKRKKKIAYITLEWVDAWDLKQSINDISEQILNGTETYLNTDNVSDNIALKYAFSQHYDIERRKSFEKEIDNQIHFVVKSKISKL